MKSDRRNVTFAEVVADAKAQPAPRAPQRPGRTGRHWVDPAGRVFSLANDALLPDDAKRLAEQGAAVVYDHCGCGGSECRLDWLGPVDVERLATAAAPILHPSKHGLARLAEWRTDAGDVLIEAAVEITWGERIRG